MMELLSSPETWVALLTLTILEIVLGIDNIVFISIISDKLPKEKQKRAKKMMLWFGIISLIMSFAGLTSAFIVSSSREDWLADFVLPNSFIYSTLIIFLSISKFSISEF